MSATRRSSSACFGIGCLESVGDQVVERVLDERLDQFVRGVVRAGGGAFVALGEGECRSAVVHRCRKTGSYSSRPFVDGAEFLDVERGVVDADELAVVGMLVEAERAESSRASTSLPSVQSASGPMAGGLNRSPASGATPSLCAGAVGLEQAEGGEQGEPEIVVAAVGEVALFARAAQACRL